MLTYARIPAEDLSFREKFLNATFVTDNGGVFTGTPSYLAGGGVQLDGSTYATYADFDTALLSKTAIFSLNIRFKATDTSSVQVLLGSAVAGDDRVSVTMNSGTIRCGFWNGAAYVSKSSASFTDTSSEHLITFTSNAGTIVAYLDGVVMPGANSPQSDVTTNLVIGARQDGASFFTGNIYDVSVVDRVLTAEEVSDYYAQDTFSEVDASKCEMWLPLRTRYDDGANMITPNLGTIASSNFKCGDGSTSTTYPTPQEHNGFFFDGGDYLQAVSTSEMNWDGASSFTVGCLMRTPDDVFEVIFGKHTNADPYGSGVGWTLHKHTTAGLRTYFRVDDGHRVFGDAPNTMIRDGQWHFVALVVDIVTGFVTVWVDDTAGTPVDISGIGDTTNAQPFQVGAAVSIVSVYDGYMKFPFFKREALTQTQLKWMKDYMFNNLNI